MTADEIGRWVAAGGAIATAWMLLRVLMAYQRAFITDGAVKIKELRDVEEQLREDIAVERRARIEAEAACADETARLRGELQATRIELNATREELAVTRHQLAEALERRDPETRTRRTDPDT